MKVWVAQRCVPYEGCQLIGVFATPEDVRREIAPDSPDEVWSIVEHPWGRAMGYARDFDIEIDEVEVIGS